MMEIGSFIELQLDKGLEYYKGDKNIARLNTGRAAIYHAFRLTCCNSIWVPVYQCDTVRSFLFKKGVQIQFYHIDKDFNPVDIHQKPGEAVLLVNYFGVMSAQRMKDLATRFDNVIIDNSQAFFCEPLEGCLSVYSCRKFVGVPDGAYVIGKGAHHFVDSYEQGFSSDTSSFLLQRIEYGCEGHAYESRMLNEHRIDSEDIKKMSPLTRAILDGTNYSAIREKRKKNFLYASNKFGKMNKLDPLQYYDGTVVPMVYPLLVEEEKLLDRLQKAKHFQGHWWSYIVNETNDDLFENWISKFIIPITIDQRYGNNEIDFLYSVVTENSL